MSCMTRSARKRQTRLNFSLLPSSPAAKSYPEQIRQRAAAVGHDDFSSPTKKRCVASSLQSDTEFIFGVGNTLPAADSKIDPYSLPTPAASSQTEPRRSKGRQGAILLIIKYLLTYRISRSQGPLINCGLKLTDRDGRSFIYEDLCPC